MTDAERLARAMWPDSPNATSVGIAAAQRLIDSGVVTVNPPPDPAVQISAAYWQTGVDSVGNFRRLIDDGWIVPGPRCEQ